MNFETIITFCQKEAKLLLLEYISWPVFIKYSIGWNDDVMPSQFCTRFNYRKWWKSHFQVWQLKSYLLSTLNKWGIIFLVTYFTTGVYFYLHLAKNWYFPQFHVWCMWWIVRVWHHHLTEINIHKDWSRAVFRKHGKFKKNHFFLFLIRFLWFFETFCRDNFYLFIEIMIILVRISSLNINRWDPTGRYHFRQSLTTSPFWFIQKMNKCYRPLSSLPMISYFLVPL